MSLIADVFLASGAIIAAFYCLVLSRRLRQFTDLESGVGSAVAMLATKADELDRTLKAAQTTASDSVRKLEDVSTRAEAAAKHLELLVASLHSLPKVPTAPTEKPNPFRAASARPNGASTPDGKPLSS